MSLRRLKRDSGFVYHLDIRVADPNRPGKTKRVIRSLKTQDREEAQLRYHEMAGKLYVEPVAQVAKVTLKELCARTIEYVSLDRSAGTLKDYRAAFNHLMASVAQDTPLAELTPQMVDSWRIAMGSKMMVSTLNNYVSKIRASYNLAIRWEMVDKNPLAGLKPITDTRSSQVHYLSPEEVQRILSHIDAHALGDFYGPMVRLSLYAGLRIGECCRLKKEYFQGDHLRVEMLTKGGRFRSVPLSRAAQEAAAPRMDGTSWLFPSTQNKGSHVAFRTASNFFRTTCDEIDLPDTTWHWLRHTFSARLLSAGVPILTVSRWLGHASIVITEKYYGHLVPGSQDHLIDYASLE